MYRGALYLTQALSLSKPNVHPDGLTHGLGVQQNIHVAKQRGIPTILG